MSNGLMLMSMVLASTTLSSGCASMDGHATDYCVLDAPIIISVEHDTPETIRAALKHNERYRTLCGDYGK